MPFAIDRLTTSDNMVVAWSSVVALIGTLQKSEKEKLMSSSTGASGKKTKCQAIMFSISV